MSGTARWAYGVTTVPARRCTLLPQTLVSLRAAGFDRPTLFVDGCTYEEAAGYESEFNLPVEVHRWPLLAWGNWELALRELFIRNPVAERYALFQDDFVAYRNLRAYLDACPYPDRGYWNLYTFPSNQQVAPPGYTGWYTAWQLGKGAVGLVFDRDALLCLLGGRYVAERPATPERGTKAIDGGVIGAMRAEGYKEYVHTPSLVQHRGVETTIPGNKRHPDALTWEGDTFDALELLRRPGQHAA